MGKGSSPPPSPDYMGLAGLQGQNNIDVARLAAHMANPNVYTPYGYQEVDWAGDQPRVFQSLTPQSQAIFDQQQAANLNMAGTANDQMARIRQMMSDPFTISQNPQMSIDSAGPIQRAVNPNDYQQAYGANFGTIDRAPQAGQFGWAQGYSVLPPDLQKTLDQSGLGSVNYGPGMSLDESQVAKMPINPGMTAQDAIMSRLQPQLDRARMSRETELINQGLRPGDEAWKNAMADLGQQENDQRTQAALQGLGLDMSANNQGFGQAQARFGAGLQGSAANNAAQEQAFNERVKAGEFGNAAQLAAFGAGTQGLGSYNQAIAQNFNMALAAQQAANQAQQQGFGQAQTLQDAYNQAQQQGFANQMAAMQGNNSAQAQQYGQNAQNAQFYNQALQQYVAQLALQRNQPINEINALLSGSQVQAPNFPGWQSQPIQPSPIYQAGVDQGNFNMQRYQTQMANRNSFMNGLFGLGGALGSAAILR